MEALEELGDYIVTALPEAVMETTLSLGGRRTARDIDVEWKKGALEWE